ncbi:hypothetical protein [Bacillus dakarensis]|uniref:hypothetical protein n=1 Tax=Robertmurraya dakarensis TaxID=1926278 RepID=UPI000A0766FC|nr:hypothetical protein [Bacillus dakarensis]
MTNKYLNVSIKTMTDYHLESFIRCPHAFYYEYILMLNSSHSDWRNVVQSVINRIVHHFYQLPLKEQKPLNLMKLIQHYWKDVDVQLFESKENYYMILAKTTDHLLKFLPSKKKQMPPLFLYQKLNTFIAELETQVSVTFEVAEWSVTSFSIKKYLMEADEQLIQLYYHLISVFSDKAFGKLPDKIEIISLLDGKRHAITPTSENLEIGIMYLKYMKILLEEPNNYYKDKSITDCGRCPFVHKCQEIQVSANEFNKYEDLFH